MGYKGPRDFQQAGTDKVSRGEVPREHDDFQPLLGSVLILRLLSTREQRYPGLASCVPWPQDQEAGSAGSQAQAPMAKVKGSACGSGELPRQPPPCTPDLS